MYTFLKNFILCPKMGKTVFDLLKEKNNYFEVSLQIKLEKQSRNTFPPFSGSKNI